MRYVRLAILFLSIAALLAGCQQDPLVEPDLDNSATELANVVIDPERAAAEFMRLGGFEFDQDVALPDRLEGSADKMLHHVMAFDREDLGDGIAHYSATLQVGWGEHDQIVLHRVVKERRPGCPKRAAKNIFLLHGDGVGFVKFLYGPAAPSVDDDHAAAIYLAQNGVDVWGMDQNWVLTPEETADFGFMAEWGMDNQIGNLRTGLAVARFVRLFSGNGFGKMNLLGYSSGGVTGYAYVNDEAGRPACQRHVGGFVVADILYKYAPEDDAVRQFICADAEVSAARLAAGEYGDWVFFSMLGELGALDPDGASPLLPGFTNQQAVLVAGAATFMLVPAGGTWHYFGGRFDPESGMPYDFRFTNYDGVTDFMRTACDWEALRFIHDVNTIFCDEDDVPWDDNLSAIEVPVLYLEPAGGIGALGRYTLGLLGSTDIEIATASLMPPEQIVEDFGHIDMWTATEAPELVWNPLLRWIGERTPRGHGRGPHVRND